MGLELPGLTRIGHATQATRDAHLIDAIGASTATSCHRKRRAVIASFLLLGGLALLSVVTATITSGFVARAQRESRSRLLLVFPRPYASSPRDGTRGRRPGA